MNLYVSYDANIAPISVVCTLTHPLSYRSEKSYKIYISCKTSNSIAYIKEYISNIICCKEYKLPIEYINVIFNGSNLSNYNELRIYAFKTSSSNYMTLPFDIRLTIPKLGDMVKVGRIVDKLNNNMMDICIYCKTGIEVRQNPEVRQNLDLECIEKFKILQSPCYHFFCSECIIIFMKQNIDRTSKNCMIRCAACDTYLDDIYKINNDDTIEKLYDDK